MSPAQRQALQGGRAFVRSAGRALGMANVPQAISFLGLARQELGEAVGRFGNEDPMVEEVRQEIMAVENETMRRAAGGQPASLEDLLDVVKLNLLVLRDRDRVPITGEQVEERARNLVLVLTTSFEVRALGGLPQGKVG